MNVLLTPPFEKGRLGGIALMKTALRIVTT
jgi:hypothetical protein